MKKMFLFVIIIVTLVLVFSPFNLAADKTSFSVIINEKKVSQGGVITLFIKGKELDKLNIYFNNQQIKTYNEKKEELFSLIPVSYWMNPGFYSLIIKKDNKVLYQKNIDIQAVEFPSSYVTVDKEKEKIVRPDNNDEIIKRKKQDKDLLQKAIAHPEQAKLWRGAFIWPVESEISTDFGATRYVNNKLQSKHSGIDIAAPMGTPIKAANRGIVKLAADLLTTGNTVIIDHGWGVFSSYSHLKEINVQADQLVEKGAVLGRVGNSGFSTGPHLHWVIKINNTFINPREFFDNDLFDS